MKYRAPSIVLAALALAACVYRIDIQQGNLLDDEDINQVDVGTTRSQVQFLLGTPMIADSFHRDRWDYAYYYRQGRSPDAEQMLLSPADSKALTRRFRPDGGIAAAKSRATVCDWSCKNCKSGPHSCLALGRGTHDYDIVIQGGKR